MTAVDLTIPAALDRTRALAPADWAHRITAAYQSSVGGIIEAGRLLIDAKAALPHGAFEAMVAADLPFGARTAQMLMKIAGDPKLGNAKHISLLPPSWGTLYELTKLPDETFEAKIVDGTINPGVERKDIVALLPRKPKNEKPKRAPRKVTVTAPPESQHDRDLRALIGVWEGSCESAREAFREFINQET